jgi:ABC-type glycerol-3-phosphate transport system substrate-binding protein
MKGRLTAGILAIALGLSGCGSSESAEAIVTTAAPTAATFEMSTTAKATSTPKTTTTTTTHTTTDSPVTTSATTQIHESKELLNLDDVINDIETRNEYFVVID